MTDVTIAFKALSEQIRVRLLLVLMREKSCVCELMATFNMAQSKLSHHLITLREAGFLRDEKRGKWNYYVADMQSMDPTRRRLVASLAESLENDSTVAKDWRKLKKVKERMQICC